MNMATSQIVQIRSPKTSGPSSSLVKGRLIRARKERVMRTFSDAISRLYFVLEGEMKTRLRGGWGESHDKFRGLELD